MPPPWGAWLRTFFCPFSVSTHVVNTKIQNLHASPHLSEVFHGSACAWRFCAGQEPCKALASDCLLMVRRGHERHVDIPVLSAKRPSRCGSFPCPQRFIVRLGAGKCNCVSQDAVEVRFPCPHLTAAQRCIACLASGLHHACASPRERLACDEAVEKLARAKAFRKTPSRCGSQALTSAQRCIACHVSRAACIMQRVRAGSALCYAPCMHMRLAGA